MPNLKSAISNLKLLAVFLALAVAQGCVQQTKYDSPENAVKSLTDALRAGDSAKVKSILGDGSEEILSSGDKVADENAREAFLAAYDEKHDLEEDDDGYVTLVVGNKAWPMP